MLGRLQEDARLQFLADAGANEMFNYGIKKLVHIFEQDLKYWTKLKTEYLQSDRKEHIYFKIYLIYSTLNNLIKNVTERHNKINTRINEILSNHSHFLGTLYTLCIIVKNQIFNALSTISTELEKSRADGILKIQYSDVNTLNGNYQMKRELITKTMNKMRLDVYMIIENELVSPTNILQVYDLLKTTLDILLSEIYNLTEMDGKQLTVDILRTPITKLIFSLQEYYTAAIPRQINFYKHNWTNRKTNRFDMSLFRKQHLISSNYEKLVALSLKQIWVKYSSFMVLVKSQLKKVESSGDDDILTLYMNDTVWLEFFKTNYAVVPALTNQNQYFLESLLFERELKVKEQLEFTLLMTTPLVFDQRPKVASQQLLTKRYQDLKDVSQKQSTKWDTIFFDINRLQLQMKHKNNASELNYALPSIRTWEVMKYCFSNDIAIPSNISTYFLPTYDSKLALSAEERMKLQNIHDFTFDLDLLTQQTNSTFIALTFCRLFAAYKLDKTFMTYTTQGINFKEIFDLQFKRTLPRFDKFDHTQVLENTMIVLMDIFVAIINKQQQRKVLFFEHLEKYIYPVRLAICEYLYKSYAQVYVSIDSQSTESGPMWISSYDILTYLHQTFGVWTKKQTIEEVGQQLSKLYSEKFPTISSWLKDAPTIYTQEVHDMRHWVLNVINTIDRNPKHSKAITFSSYTVKLAGYSSIDRARIIQSIFCESAEDFYLLLINSYKEAKRRNTTFDKVLQAELHFTLDDFKRAFSSKYLPSFKWFFLPQHDNLRSLTGQLMKKHTFRSKYNTAIWNWNYMKTTNIHALFTNERFIVQVRMLIRLKPEILDVLVPSDEASDLYILRYILLNSMNTFDQIYYTSAILTEMKQILSTTRHKLFITMLGQTCTFCGKETEKEEVCMYCQTRN